MSDLVGNQDCWFSQPKAHITVDIHVGELGGLVVEYRAPQ